MIDVCVCNDIRTLPRDAMNLSLLSFCFTLNMLLLHLSPFVST